MTITHHIAGEPGSLSILIAEEEMREDGFLPVSPVASLAEAVELAEDHFRRLAADPDNAPLCPSCYTVWSRGRDGYQLHTTLTP